LDEWAALQHPDAAIADRSERAPGPAPGLDEREAPNVVANRRAFLVMVRNELWKRVDLAARERDEELLALDPGVPWASALDDYYREHDEIGTGPDARSAARLVIDERPDRWTVRQILDDPAGHHDWGIDA